MRFLFIILAFAVTAFAGYMPRRSGGQSITPPVIDLSGYAVDYVSVPTSNAVADALATSGITGGSITFPLGARPGNYLPSIKGVNLAGGIDANAVFVVYAVDGNPIYEIGFNVDGGGTNWINSGATHIEIACTAEEAIDPVACATLIVNQVVAYGFTTVEAVGGTVQFTIAGDNDVSEFTVTGNLLPTTVREGGFSSATRRASITTLLSRGWTVINRK